MHSKRRSHRVPTLIVAVALLAYGAFGVFQDWQFAADDLPQTTGVVSAPSGPFRWRFAPFSWRRVGYIVNYTYKVQNQTYVSSASVGLTTLNRIQIAHEVPVKYLPGWPGVSRIDFPLEDQGFQFRHWLTILAGALFLSISFFSHRRPWSDPFGGDAGDPRPPRDSESF